MLPTFAPGSLCVALDTVESEVFDPQEPPETRYRLAPYLTFGAQIELEFESFRNLDLNARSDDDSSLLTPELALAASFDPAPRFQAFVDVALSREFVLEGPLTADAREDVVLEVTEAFVLIRQVPGGVSAQVGRQRFEDEREWLYDEGLDAVRLRYDRGPLAVELSASRDGMMRTDLLGPPESEQINTYVLRAAYGLPASIELATYAIVRDDRAADRRHLVFLGVSSWGEPVQDLDYWLELATVGGEDGPNRIRGWGVDLGVTYELQVGPKPALTLGVAFGSGDSDPDDGLDRSFRQTGLHRNEADFGGSATFKYYGEVLDPELSNLAIATVGIGVRPRDNVSLDLVYHYYVQHRTSTELRNTAIDAQPSGRRQRLGSEVDLILGLVEIGNRVDVEAAVGYFMPGAAFPDATGETWGMAATVLFRF
jgi:alginate production protein